MVIRMGNDEVNRDVVIVVIKNMVFKYFWVFFVIIYDFYVVIFLFFLFLLIVMVEKCRVFFGD